MRFIITSSFSHELTNKRHREPLVELENQLNAFFENETYGERLTTIYCGVICVSQGFDQFFTVRLPKWGRKNPDLQVEIKIDFNAYSSMDGNNTDRLRYVAPECYETIQTCLALKSPKGFDKERFLGDLKSCFKQGDLLPG